MTTLSIIKLWAKVWAARWLRITSKLSAQELDELLHACAGDPKLRGFMEDILKQRT